MNFLHAATRFEFTLTCRQDFNKTHFHREDELPKQQTMCQIARQGFSRLPKSENLTGIYQTNDLTYFYFLKKMKLEKMELRCIATCRPHDVVLGLK